jgi:hypothetical protein
LSAVPSKMRQGFSIVTDIASSLKCEVKVLLEGRMTGSGSDNEPFFSCPPALRRSML